MYPDIFASDKLRYADLCSSDVAILRVDMQVSSAHYDASWQDERLFGNKLQSESIYEGLVTALSSYYIDDEDGGRWSIEPNATSIDDYR